MIIHRTRRIRWNSPTQTARLGLTTVCDGNGEIIGNTYTFTNLPADGTMVIIAGSARNVIRDNPGFIMANRDR